MSELKPCPIREELQKWAAATKGVKVERLAVFDELPLVKPQHPHERTGQ